MKKNIVLILIILACFATTVFSASPPIPETAQPTLLRDNILADDTSVITVAASDTARVGGYSQVTLEFNIEGTSNPSWNATVYFSGDTAWVSAGSRTITADEFYIVRTLGYELMTVLLDSSSGTNPAMTVNVTPLND